LSTSTPAVVAPNKINIWNIWGQREFAVVDEVHDRRHLIVEAAVQLGKAWCELLDV